MNHHFWALLAVCAFAGSLPAQAEEISNPTVSKAGVAYRCEHGQRLKVTYGFNQEKLPTFAEAALNGKRRHMPINLAHSNHTGTFFGTENNFRLSTGYMDQSSFRRLPVMITGPDDKILFKNCRPVRS